jgi:excisionase family DNA binding protein
MKEDTEKFSEVPIQRSPSMPLLEDDPLLTVNEVARYLKVSPSTVRALAKKRVLAAVKVGKSWRFKQSSITAAISNPQSVK